MFANITSHFWAQRISQIIQIENATFVWQVLVRLECLDREWADINLIKSTGI